MSHYKDTMNPHWRSLQPREEADSQQQTAPETGSREPVAVERSETPLSSDPQAASRKPGSL